MRNALKNLDERFSETTFAVGTILFGIYVSFHINYLDKPSITPFPPPPDMREFLGFTDDLWFAIMLMFVGLITFLSIMLKWNKIRNFGMVIISVIYAFCTAEFFARGVLTDHFNVSWIAYAVIFVLIERTIYKGGGRK